MIDVGAIIGSLSLGFISDRMHGRRSIVAFISIVIASTTSFCIYVYVLKMPHSLLNFLMFILGFCVSGLTNMIAAACSSDLGRQEALKGNERAAATVTGIIDGTGTLGSGFGQLIIGMTQKHYGWYNGYLLVVAITITVTSLPLFMIGIREVKEL
jgi:MFS transporter, OPA family, solute carrier family 37 (glycerol-3-phosphate transporter), member 3